MNRSHASDDPLGRLLRSDDAGEELRDQAAQVEAVVESEAEGTEVVVRILRKAEVLVGAVDHRLGVGDHGVDPPKAGQIARLAVADDDEAVGAAGLDDPGEAGQAVAEHVAAGPQVGAGPRGHRTAGEAGDGAELGTHGPAVVADFDSRDERHLVLRASTGGAWALATQVGIVELDVALQRALGVGLCHRLHDLVVQQPGRPVVHAQLPLQRQGRQAGLGLADEVHGQQPGAQRKLRAVHHRAGGHRGLMAAGATLQHTSTRADEAAEAAAAAARTAKAIGPAKRLQFEQGLLLGAIALQEFGHRHALLKLHPVRRHGHLRCEQREHRTGRLAHTVSYWGRPSALAVLAT
jgi:hypothetical protein